MLEKQDLNLNGAWRLQQCGKQCDYAAQVPGDLLLDLLHAGVITDPNYRENYRDCKWVGRENWRYQREFTVALVAGACYTLVFAGLAGVAKIFVNG